MKRASGSSHVDRLIHVLLVEELGRKAPPDLAPRILARVGQRRLRRWPRWATYGAAAAAMVLICTYAACWTLLHWGYPAIEMKNLAALQGGLHGTLEEPAHLVLGGYCTLEVTPGSRIRLEGQPYAEQVYLAQGEVHCLVEREKARSGATFAVRTDVGLVRVTGTEFLVRVIEPTKGDSMKRMFVKVIAGAVLCSSTLFADVALRAGEEMTLPAEGKTGVAAAGTEARSEIERLLGERHSLEFAEITIEDALAHLRNAGGVKIQYKRPDREVSPINLCVRDMKWKNILNWIMIQTRLACEVRDDMILIREPQTQEEAQVNKASREPGDEKQILASLDGKRMTVDYNATPLLDVLRALAEAYKVNLVLDSGVDAQTPITLTVQEMAGRQILDWICKLTGLQYRILWEAVYVFRGEVKQEPKVVEAGDSGDEEIKRALEEKRVSVEFNETPLSEVVRVLAQKTDVKFVLDAKVNAKTPVTLTVTDMTVAKTLQWLSLLLEVRFDVHDGCVDVAPKGPGGNTPR